MKLTLLHYGVDSKESRISKRAVSPDRGVSKQRGKFLWLHADLETFGVSAHLVLCWQNNDGNPSQRNNREQNH